MCTLLIGAVALLLAATPFVRFLFVQPRSRSLSGNKAASGITFPFTPCVYVCVSLFFLCCSSGGLVNLGDDCIFFLCPCMTDGANLCVVFLSPNLVLLKRDRRPVNLQWELWQGCGFLTPSSLQPEGWLFLKDNDFGFSAAGGMLFVSFHFAG